MTYKIINKARKRLSAFHSNGGWEIGDVFPCSINCWIPFKTKEEAEDYLKYMLKESEDQRDRWGDWTDVAIKFIKTLKIIKE